MTSRALLGFFFGLFFLVSLPFSAQTSEKSTPLYSLQLDFDTAHHSLTGQVKISINGNTGLRLATERLTITSARAIDTDGRSTALAILPGKELVLDAGLHAQEVRLEYSATYVNDDNNQITPEGIVLLHGWYPVPDKPVLFHLEANLPDGFQAIWQTDSYPPARQGSRVMGGSQTPATELSFAAGPYQIKSRTIRPNLSIHTLFFKEDQELANQYLDDTGKYIERFEKILGPFPYPNFSIVANRQPTGLGLPSFTLLGQAVLRLPFIRATSLGHEILHSWFGNSIAVDYQRGNWCEGLTSYLADHAFREDKGEGLAYRKESLLQYHSYINEQTAIPLRSFISAQPHNQQERPLRAVGYGRGTMLFHELRERIGSEAFTTALKNLTGRVMQTPVSWDDLEQIFSAAASDNLHDFFSERLDRSDIPSLALDTIQIQSTGKDFRLNFHLKQTTAEPYHLKVPIRVFTSSGASNYSIHVAKKDQECSLTLPERPLSFVIDPEYSKMRTLTHDELPPTWSRFQGDRKKLVFVSADAGPSLYAPLISALQDESWQIIPAGKEVPTQDLESASLLFLGTQHPTCQALFAPKELRQDGATIDIRNNPLAPTHVAVLLSSSAPQESRAIAQKINHYVGYSYLQFVHGQLQSKKIRDTDSGQKYQLEELPDGTPTTALSRFEENIRQLSANRVIYIGEQHDSVADHRLQLRILEYLLKLQPNLAIGMEMFPASRQAALDRYTMQRSDIDEKQFLKESGYFSVWGYDYRLFRDIFQFARRHQIPVVGLNIDKEISQSFFRNGGPDKLTQEERAQLPPQRDLDLPGYQDRLQMVHSFHHKGMGSGSQSGFLQAQAVWDEKMAESIATYLSQHPDTIMVVLTGNEHARKDSGIPPRVARRLPVPQATVINIAGNPDPGSVQETADYSFLASREELPEQGKMGVVLEEKSVDGKPRLTIIDFSESGKAKGSGLAKGDEVLQIDSQATSSMEDIRIAMIDAAPGDTVQIRVKRSGQELSFPVELTGPDEPARHPRR